MAYPNYNGGPTGYYQPDPLVSFPPTPSVAGDRSPFKVSVVPDPSFPDTRTVALVGEGSIFESPSSLETKKGDITEASSGIRITGEGVVFVTRTLGQNPMKLGDTEISFDFVPVDFTNEQFRLYTPENAFTEVPPLDLVTSRYPLAKIVDATDPNATPPYQVIQVTRNNLMLSTQCANGSVIPSYRPI
jgi:hypothetical protein